MSQLLKQIQERNPAALHHIRIVSFAGDAAALAAGPQFALFAAGKGIHTEMLTCPHPAAAALRAACAVARSRDDLHLSNDATAVSTAPLTVSVDVVDGLEPMLVKRYQGSTYLAVSPGSAKAEDFARLALAALESGETIDGIIVVNADPNDTFAGAGVGNPDLPDKVARLPSGHVRSQLGRAQIMDSAPEHGYLR
jgi:hypothetical protein